MAQLTPHSGIRGSGRLVLRSRRFLTDGAAWPCCDRCFRAQKVSCPLRGNFSWLLLAYFTQGRVDLGRSGMEALPRGRIKGNVRMKSVGTLQELGGVAQTVRRRCRRKVGRRCQQNHQPPVRPGNFPLHWKSRESREMLHLPQEQGGGHRTPQPVPYLHEENHRNTRESGIPSCLALGECLYGKIWCLTPIFPPFFPPGMVFLLQTRSWRWPSSWVWSRSAS